MYRDHAIQSHIKEVRFPSNGISCLERGVSGVPNYASKHRCKSLKLDHKRKRMSYAALVWGTKCIDETSITRLIGTVDVLRHVLHDQPRIHCDNVEKCESKLAMWERISELQKSTTSSLQELADSTRIPDTYDAAVKRMVGPCEHNDERQRKVQSFLRVFEHEGSANGEFTISCSLGSLSTTIVLEESQSEWVSNPFFEPGQWKSLCWWWNHFLAFMHGSPAIAESSRKTTCSIEDWWSYIKGTMRAGSMTIKWTLKLKMVAFLSFRTRMMRAEERKAVEDYKWKVARAHKFGLGLNQAAMQSLPNQGGQVVVINPEGIAQLDGETRWTDKKVAPFNDKELALRKLLRSTINQVAPNLLKRQRGKVRYKDIAQQVNEPGSLTARRLSAFVRQRKKLRASKMGPLKLWAGQHAPGVMRAH